jgi:hypothetical protein
MMQNFFTNTTDRLERIEKLLADLTAPKPRRERQPRQTIVRDANGNGKRGRKSAYAGKYLYRKAETNPRREGSAAWENFKKIRNGMTYEKFIADGGNGQQLRLDIEQKFVEVTDKRK